MSNTFEGSLLFFITNKETCMFLFYLFMNLVFLLLHTLRFLLDIMDFITTPDCALVRPQFGVSMLLDFIDESLNIVQNLNGLHLQVTVT